MRERYLFNSVFFTILQIFSQEVTLIRDQVLINVGAMVHTSLKAKLRNIRVSTNFTFLSDRLVYMILRGQIVPKH